MPMLRGHRMSYDERVQDELLGLVKPILVFLPMPNLQMGDTHFRLYWLLRCVKIKWFQMSEAGKHIAGCLSLLGFN